MRIDLYLKKSRLIKRRKIANEAVKKNLVLVNDLEIKPSYKVKLNDVITLKLGVKIIKVKTTSLTKQNNLMYELLEEKFQGQKD